MFFISKDLATWHSIYIYIYVFCLLNFKAPKDGKVSLTAHGFFLEPLIHSYTSLSIHITVALQVEKTDNTSRLEPKITRDIGDSHPDGSPYIGRNQCQTHRGFFFSKLCAREDFSAVSDPYVALQKRDRAGYTTRKTALPRPFISYIS